MITLLAETMTFGEALGTPTIDYFGRFSSPGFIVMYGMIAGMIRIYLDIRGILKPIRAAWEGGDFKLVLKLVQEAIPVILEAVEKARKVIPPSSSSSSVSSGSVSGPPAGDIVRPLVDPLANAQQQWAVADAAGDKELADFWAERYHKLDAK
jgi:hypothetical protein